jgi:hypothetical protein
LKKKTLLIITIANKTGMAFLPIAECVLESWSWIGERSIRAGEMPIIWLPGRLRMASYQSRLNANDATKRRI